MRSITSRELGWCKDKCTALCLTTSMSPCVFPCPLTACWRNMNVPCTRGLSPGLAAPLRERKKETKERDHLMREPILFSYRFHSIFFWSHWQKSQGKPLKEQKRIVRATAVLLFCMAVCPFLVSMFLFRINWTCLQKHHFMLFLQWPSVVNHCGNRYCLCSWHYLCSS